MGKYSNEPRTDARLIKSHDKWATNEDEWQRIAHAGNEDEQNEENEQTPDPKKVEPPKRDARYIEIERQRQFINPAMDIHEQL